MTSPARIPRAMTIIPQVGGLSEFQNDLKTATAAVRNFRNEVNSISRTISTGSTAATRAGTSQFGLFGAAIGTVDGAIRGSLGTLNSFGQGIVNVGSLIERTGSITRRMAFDLERVGRGLLVFITLPAIAAGKAIVEWGSEFEKELKKIETLVGVNENVVARWGERILNVAPELGKMPVELAEGLFFAASGFGSMAAAGDQAFEVLVASAKASVLGMGEVADIARAATSVMNVYGEELGSANRAVEILMLTTREGNFEIDKLADSLGGVIGLAKEVSVEFEDLGASIATLTRAGFSPSESITVIRSALLNLVSPSKENKEILDALGYSFENLTKKLGDDGLLGVLFDLRTRLGAEGFLDFFNIRAVRGVTTLTGELADDYVEIMDIMERSGTKSFDKISKSGSDAAKYVATSWQNNMNATANVIAGLDESFSKVFDTVSFKFGAFQSGLQSAAINIFQMYEQDIKDFLDRMIDATQSIRKFITENKETTKTIVQIVAALALLGPAIIIFSRLLSASSFFFTVIGRGAIIVGSLVKGFAGLLTAGYSVATFITSTLFRAISSIASAAYRAVTGITMLIVRFLTFVGTNIAAGLVKITTGMVGFAAAVFQTGSMLLFATAGMLSFVSTKVIGGIGAVASAFGSVLVALLPIAGTLGGILAAVVLVSGAIFLLAKAASKVGELVASAFDWIKQKIENFLGKLSDKTGEKDFKSWGQGLMKAFSDGLIDGFIYVVDTLNALGQVLADWLKPSSPPKITPDLDKWGTKAMQVYMDGWAKADFSILKEIGDTIKSYLIAITSEIGEKANTENVINAVLGSRSAIAEAISQMKKFGKVTEDSFQKIFSAIGMTTPELENYIRAMFDVAAATNKVAEAQQKVNDINERYDNLLDPISRRLKEIQGIRDEIDSAARVKELQKVLENKFAPERVKYLASLELEEIQLKIDQATLEQNKTNELSMAERQLVAAEKQLEDSQAQLEYWEGLIGIQEDTYSLLQEIANATKETAKKLEELKGSAPLEFDEAGNLPSPKKFSLDDIFGDGGVISQILGPYDEKLEELKKKLGELKITWGTVFDNMKTKVTTWWTELDLQGKIEEVKTWSRTYLSPIGDALKDAGTETWESLKELGKVFNENFGDGTGWTQFVDTAKELLYEILEGLPGAIDTLSDAINGEGGLVDAIKDAIPVMADFNEKRKNFGLGGGPFGVIDKAFGISLGGPIVPRLPIDQLNVGEGSDFWKARQEIKDGTAEANENFVSMGLAILKLAGDFSLSSGQMVGALQGVGAGTGDLRTDFTFLNIATGYVKTKFGELGDYLSIQFSNAVGNTKTKVTDLIDNAIKLWQTAVEEVEELFTSLVDYGRENVVPFLENLSSTITTALTDAFGPFLQWLKDSNTESGIFSGFLEAIKGWMEKVTEVMEPLNKAWETFVGWISAAVEKLKALPQWMIDFFKKYGFLPDEEDEPEDDSSINNDSEKISSAIIDAVRIINSQVSPPVSPVGNPVFAPSAGLAYSGITISFGEVNINNGMDLAQFEATVRNVVNQSIEGY